MDEVEQMTTTPQHPTGARRRGSDTRAKIRTVAIGLFTENGYEATSMREIAEELGITKAALYYHFNSKEAIVLSLFGDYVRNLDELIEWGTAQPRSAELVADFLDRWITLNVGCGLEIMSFVAANHTALRSVFPKDKAGLPERIDRACRVMLEPDAPLWKQLRARMALMCVHDAVMAARHTEATDADILAAAQFAARRLAEGLINGDQTSVSE